MKILLVNRYLYRKGGSEAVMYNTADLLRAAGHEVLLFGCEDSRNMEYPAPIYTCKTWPDRKGKLLEAGKYFNNCDAARRMDEVLSKEKPDIVHIHLFLGSMTPSVLGVIHRHGIPVVHSVHDYRLVCPAYTFRNGKGEVCEKCAGGHFLECLWNRCSKGNWLFSLVMALEMKYRNRKWHPASELDGLIYVSRFAKDKHEQVDPLFKCVNSTVLYNCSNLSELYPERPEDDGYYLYYGRLSYEKGIKTLIDAVKRIPAVRLKVVGTGPMEEHLRACCADAPNIEFLGYHSGASLYEIVRRARFVCVPSEWYENNPMTIVEAYSLGVPVIGADIGGIPEIVKDGETGFLFESGNTEDLIRCIDESMRMGNDDYKTQCDSAHKFSTDNFNPVTYVDELIAFYVRTSSLFKKI